MFEELILVEEIGEDWDDLFDVIINFSIKLLWFHEFITKLGQVEVLKRSFSLQVLVYEDLKTLQDLFFDIGVRFEAYFHDGPKVGLEIKSFFDVDVVGTIILAFLFFWIKLFDSFYLLHLLAIDFFSLLLEELFDLLREWFRGNRLEMLAILVTYPLGGPFIALCD